MPLVKINILHLKSNNVFHPKASNYYQTVDYLNYLDRTKQGQLVEILMKGEHSRYALVKTKFSIFGIDILWCPGGIIEDATLKVEEPVTYVKRRCILLVGTLQTSCDQHAVRIVGADKTIILKVEDFKNGSSMSKNWRKNQRRSYQAGTIVRSASISDVSEIFCQIKKLEKFKEIKLGIDVEFIEFVLRCPDCVCLIAEDKDKLFLGFRAAYFSESKTFDLIAVNSFEGKRCYASYLLVTEIINEACRRGIQYFDFGGMDKENNLPVYNFKKGIGGEEVFYKSELLYNLHPVITKMIKILLRK